MVGREVGWSSPKKFGIKVGSRMSISKQKKSQGEEHIVNVEGKVGIEVFADESSSNRGLCLSYLSYIRKSIFFTFSLVILFVLKF